MTQAFDKYLTRKTEAAPLAAFRVLFGAVMFVSMLRFWYNGWIEKLYIDPTFFFSYYGFEFIKPLGQYTYLIFIVCGIASLCVAFGYKYRLAIITFFITFTYIELMDKTTYLNHYYFVSVVSFLMVFLPANTYFSIDAKNEKSGRELVPVWTIDALKLLIAIVYFYAGLAKLNSDWLVQAMPLKIWLPSNYDLPVIGGLLQQQWTHYAFSWSGAVYDLSVPFLLFYKRTRWFAFGMVVVFHLLTSLLFPIGMFPYLMILSALIFFDARIHKIVLARMAWIMKTSLAEFNNGKEWMFKSKWVMKATYFVVLLFFMVQLALPFRQLLYPGELFWTEEGFRFSWRVMLMEKAGYANFKVVDPESGTRFYVQNDDFLTPLQEKQMSVQPDFILQFAHHLEQYFSREGAYKGKDLQVFVESHVALNGRRSKPYIDPTRDLTIEKESFRHKDWILPFGDEIKGL